MIKFDWFKVGAELYYLGYGKPYTVTEINEAFLDHDGIWTALYDDGYKDYPIIEVYQKFWLPYHIDFRKNKED